MVRLRQLIDQVRHRLLFVPALSVVVAVVLAQVMLVIDGALADENLPQTLQTTVGSGRAILTALAGGLISTITLLLSLTMVAVQLASSQFSPRTVRSWIGDRTQQRAIGVVLGTAVYCLLILRETRSLEEGEALTPHLSVIGAVGLGIVSLVAVVRSVDHITDTLRVGSVAARIADETIELVERAGRVTANTVADGPALAAAVDPTPPSDAVAVESETSGWIQQIDVDQMLEATAAGSTVFVPSAVGEFVPAHAPLAWVAPTPDDECAGRIREAFALGDTRTMQSDVGFGILQLVDIALRALSPGLNDPNTANDIVVRLGGVMLALWAQPLAPAVVERDGRRLVRRQFDHRDHLDAAFEPIRFHATDEPLVTTTLLRTLRQLESETTRRALAGPLGPVRDMIERVAGESSVSLADNSLDS